MSCDSCVFPAYVSLTKRWSSWSTTTLLLWLERARLLWPVSVGNWMTISDLSFSRLVLVSRSRSLGEEPSAKTPFVGGVATAFYRNTTWTRHVRCFWALHAIQVRLLLKVVEEMLTTPAQNSPWPPQLRRIPQLLRLQRSGGTSWDCSSWSQSNLTTLLRVHSNQTIKALRSYLMNKYIFFCVIPAINKIKLLLLLVKSERSQKNQEKKGVPVYKAIAITHIEPFHCALNSCGCNNTFKESSESMLIWLEALIINSKTLKQARPLGHKGDAFLNCSTSFLKS